MIGSIEVNVISSNRDIHSKIASAFIPGIADITMLNDNSVDIVVNVIIVINSLTVIVSIPDITDITLLNGSSADNTDNTIIDNNSVNISNFTALIT